MRGSVSFTLVRVAAGAGRRRRQTRHQRIDKAPLAEREICWLLILRDLIDDHAPGLRQAQAVLPRCGHDLCQAILADGIRGLIIM